MRLLSFFLLMSSAPTWAQSAKPGIVVHLGILSSWRDHANFDLARSRLARANPDRRLISLVRQRHFADDRGKVRDVALDQMSTRLFQLLGKSSPPVDLVLLQMNDLSWVHPLWNKLDQAELSEDEIKEALVMTPLFVLRGRLAPTARLVFMGHSDLGMKPEIAARRARRLLEVLGAPQGTLISQVTPSILPYEAADFGRHPGHRLVASAIKGMGVSAIHHLTLGHLGPVDVALYTSLAVPIGAAYLSANTFVERRNTRDLNVEIMPKQFWPFRNFEDYVLTAAVAFGSAAMVNGFAHLGTSFLDQAFFTHTLQATGAFFVLSMAPKVIRNLRSLYGEHYRNKNRARLFDGERAEEIRATDPRLFDCARSLTK